MTKNLITIEEYCEKVRSGQIEPCTILGNPEAEAIVDVKFLASQEAFRPYVERLRDMRKFSAADLAFTVNI